MPNWCENTIIIQGEPDEVDFLLKAVESPDRPFSLDNIIKMPEALVGKSAPEKDEAIAKENQKLYGATDWYQWRITHWGTKWDVNSSIVYDNTDIMLPGLRTVKIVFDSAWAPPVEAIDVLAKRFVNTNILHTFDEPGVDFSGWICYVKGKRVEEVSLGRSYSGIVERMDPQNLSNVFENYN